MKVCHIMKTLSQKLFDSLMLIIDNYKQFSSIFGIYVCILFENFARAFISILKESLF